MMRIASVLLLVVAASLNVSAQTNAASEGTYLNTVDNRVYELRARGSSGLDIYADGRIVAMMDLDKASAQFKGDTSVLATNCPNSKGKIETVSIDAERIKMRVETPSQNIATKAKTCGGVVIGRRPWAEFSLIRQNASRTAGAEPQEPRNGAAESSEFVSEAVKFELLETKAIGSTLTMRLRVTNQGDDRIVMICQGRESGGSCGGSGVSIVDDAGNSYVVGRVTVGNKERTSALVNGVATAVTLDFLDLPTRGGILQATRIAKMTLRSYVYHESNWAQGKLATIEFRNREVSK